jgi:hypothetical protein
MGRSIGRLKGQRPVLGIRCPLCEIVTDDECSSRASPAALADNDSDDEFPEEMSETVAFFDTCVMRAVLKLQIQIQVSSVDSKSKVRLSLPLSFFPSCVFTLKRGGEYNQGQK